MKKLRQVILPVLTLLVSVGLFALMGTVSAQEGIDPNSRLVDVRVAGTSEALMPLVEVNLTAREGTPVGSIDLEAERNRVLGMGTFAEVTIMIEDRGSGPELIVRVTENPKIGEILIEGSSFNAQPFLDILADRKLLRPGATYNSVRAQEGIETLQRIYRETQEIAWPFNVPVVLTSEPMVTDGAGTSTPLRITYTIDEEASYDQIRVIGNTILDAEQLRIALGSAIPPNATLNTEEDGSVTVTTPGANFNGTVYRGLQERFSTTYNDAGYRGNGINSQQSNLTNSTLNLALLEFRIASISTTAIGVDQDALEVKPGDLFNYNQVLADVKNLAVGRDTDISLQTAYSSSGEVRVVFVPGAPASTGVIDSVQITGNTVYSDAELLPLIAMGVGDTYTTVIAEEDYRRIAERYNENGYSIIEPDVSYDSGIYTINIREVIIAGYDITFEDPANRRTSDRVITRSLPEVGSVLAREVLIQSLRNIFESGIVQPQSPTLSVNDPSNPQEVTVNLAMSEQLTRSFVPEATFSTGTGLVGSIIYRDDNFLGEAQKLSVDLNTQSASRGLLFGGSISYEVPWIDVDFLDFRETPTSFGFSLFSQNNVGNPIVSDGKTIIAHPCIAAGTCNDTEDNQVRIGNSSRRDTGFSVSFGRRIADFTRFSAGVQSNFSNYAYEDTGESGTCTIDESGNISNADECFLPSQQALAFVPTSGNFTIFRSGITFDNRNSGVFPTRGVRSNVNVGYGFGSDYVAETDTNQGYSYTEFRAGFRTYAALTPDNNVLAFRVNVGAQIGAEDYPSSNYFRIGDTQSVETLIRGYSSSDFSLSQSYLTSSVEYRYDLGLDTSVTQAIYAIGFVDLGFASETPADISNPYLSAGLGVELDLNLGGLGLPALRFDYGFSGEEPTGYFKFRIGPVF